LARRFRKAKPVPHGGSAIHSLRFLSRAIAGKGIGSI
jgi:hypothetical protein